MRAIAITAPILLLAVACSGDPGPKKPTPPRPANDAADTNAPVRPPPPVEGIACSAGPCMFHPGSGNYHECLNAAAGGCFQFGRRCFPADKCVPDGAGVYRTCAKIGEGTCLQFATGTCEPARRCAFDPASASYKTCEQLDAGKCTRFGAPCQPAPAG